MSGASILPPAHAEHAALEATLASLAAQSADAEAFLAELAAAVLPARADTWSTTWPEPGHGAAPDAAQSAEARLQSAERRYRTLVEQIPAVTFMAVLGEGKNEIYVSPHIEAMLGYSQDEWLADPFLWYFRLHEGDREMWTEEFARGCRTGGPFRAECRFLARDGHVVWVHGEARVVKDDVGRPLFLQGVAFDITESKQAQEVLLNDAVRGAKIQEELDIARRVQASILPRELRVEGLEIVASMEPASDIGGDYYDVFPFRGGAWLAIGDVAGHGLNAGLVMLMVQSALAATLVGNLAVSARDILCMLNTVLYDNIRKRMGRNEHVTFSLLRYTRDGHVSFAGAHEDLLILRRATGRVESIPSSGTWLGGARDIRRVTDERRLQLEDGDLLILYTDGVTEAMNQSGTQFDLGHLCATIEEVAGESPERVHAHVLAAVHTWMHRQDDDMTLFVARYRAPPS